MRTSLLALALIAPPVLAQVPPDAYAKIGKRYTANVYEGAGHGFLRQQTGRDGANARASAKAWAATLAFLRQNLK